MAAFFFHPEVYMEWTEFSNISNRIPDMSQNNIKFQRFSQQSNLRIWNICNIKTSGFLHTIFQDGVRPGLVISVLGLAR